MLVLPCQLLVAEWRDRADAERPSRFDEKLLGAVDVGQPVLIFGPHVVPKLRLGVLVVAGSPEPFKRHQH